MLGRNHVATGALAGLVTLPLAPAQSPAGAAAWVLGWAGTALLPDLDSHGSSAARMWGPLTQLLAAVIGRVAGGHRWGTHDLVLAPALFGAVAGLLSLARAGQVVVLAVLLGLALRGMAITGGDARLRGAAVNLALSCAGAWWLSGSVARGELLAMVPWVVAGGVVVHVLGDALTLSGVPVPVLWLADRRHTWSLGLFRTGGQLELLLVTPVLSIACLVLIYVRTDIQGLVLLLGPAQPMPGGP